MRNTTFYRLALAMIFTSGVLLLSGCSGGHTSASVYGGYGYPYYGSNWGYSSTYYSYDDRNRRERLDQSERIEHREQIKQGASNRPANGAAASRNMGRPSGGAMRGGGGRGGGRR